MEAYLPPEANDRCQCNGSPHRQMACPFGHPTACHYPLTCEQAQCERVGLADHPQLVGVRTVRADPSSGTDEQTALWLAQGIRATDTVFRDSPDAGPLCFCSRCGLAVRTEPIRLFDAGTNTERRFHHGCLGMPEVSDGEEDKDR